MSCRVLMNLFVQPLAIIWLNCTAPAAPEASEYQGLGRGMGGS